MRPPHGHPNLAIAARLAGLALALLGAAGCGSGEAPPERTLPAGTVVLIDDEPITAAEVDRYLDAMGAIDPSYTKPHRRRLALTAIAFPLAFGRHRFPRERERARAEAEAWEAELCAGELVGPLEPPLTGNWETIGLEVWVVARELEPGAWSGTVELAGQFALVRLVGRDRNLRGGHERFEVELKTFPYVDRPETLGPQCLEATLEIVDPAWDEIVPGFWKYEMRGDS